jgi:hypothetical protein
LINYHQLSLEITKLAEFKKRISEKHGLFEKACDLFASFIEAPHEYHEALNTISTELYANTLPVFQEVQELSKAEDFSYQIAAVDGSQSGPYYVQLWPSYFYLINIGSLFISYGATSNIKDTTVPELFEGEDGSLPPSEQISLRRSLFEFREAARLMKEYGRKDDLVLIDGSLIWWSLDLKRNISEYRNCLEALLSFFDLTKKNQNLPLGYISGSKASDLSKFICTLYCSDQYGLEQKPSCNTCNDDFCAFLSKLKDDLLISMYARFRNRTAFTTPVFSSSALILENYREHAIGFFYLYFNGECSRIEFPLYNFSKLDWMKQCIVDQLYKGHGYPLILSDVHQLAVITENEKNHINTMLNGYLHQQELAIAERSKDKSKGLKYV